LLALPFAQALAAFTDKEEAVRDMYQYLLEHLSLEHHAGDALQTILAELVSQETEHIALFSAMEKEARS
jgi:hypothetical protein